MTEISPQVQALQNFMQSHADQKINAKQFEELKNIALEDRSLDRDEAQFLMQQAVAGKFEDGVNEQVTALLSRGYEKQDINPTALIGYNRLTSVKQVSAEFEDLNKAKAITDENGIDEVYFKVTDDNSPLNGKTFIAYGSHEDGGVLDMRGLKPGYVGRFGDAKITLLHINNESNTAWEGAKAPWVNTWDTVSSAGQNGIVKGIGEVATTVTALFIGKTVLEKGIKTAGEGVAQQVAAQAASQAGKSLAEHGAANGIGVVGKAKALGTSIGSTVKGTLRQVAVGAAVASAVVGSVVAIGSGIGAVNGVMRSQDYATLDMITGEY